MRTPTTLIILGGFPGLSESSLGAHSFCWFSHDVDQLAITNVNCTSHCTRNMSNSLKHYLTFQFDWSLVVVHQFKLLLDSTVHEWTNFKSIARGEEVPYTRIWPEYNQNMPVRYGITIRTKTSKQ